MLVVVGGHSRNIGKTSVVAGLIRKHGTMPSQEELARLMAEHGTFLAAP